MTGASSSSASPRVRVVPGVAPSWPFDPAVATRALADADPVLGRLIARVGAFTLVPAATASTFEALARSIVFQQLHARAATTIFGRLADLGGGAVTHDVVLGATDAALRAAGLSANKALALRDLAARTARGEIPSLERLSEMDDEAIVEALVPVRGIGRWSVEMLLLFRLARPDVLAVDDFGIRKGFALTFHRGKAREELPERAVVAKRGQRWRPYRSVASWYLWRAADPPPK